mmetsp:Transcript_45586/g.90391  ORF Transcript_45586/g.90391 Transcript_45586/m.90391 type:complete len:145 (+) Transcript_45586:47-481(+)
MAAMARRAIYGLPVSQVSFHVLRLSGRTWSTGAKAAVTTATAEDHLNNLCNHKDLADRDVALAAGRDRFDSWRGAEMSLGTPLGRKLYVGNLRSADGHKRVPKLVILDSSGKKWMSLSEEDFKHIEKELPRIKDEIIKYRKKLD